MNEDFPFDHFLPGKNKNTSQQVNNNKNLKELRLDALSKQLSQNNTSNEKLFTEDINISNSDPMEHLSSQNSDSCFSNEELDLVRNEILSNLKSSINPQKFNAFFENSFFLIDITFDSVIFSVTTPFIKTMIQNHYVGEINNAIVNNLGKSYNIEIQVSNRSKEANNEAPQSVNTVKTKTKSAKEATFTLALTPTKDDLLSKVESQYIDHMNPESNRILIDRNKTFDNFIIGPSNNLANAASQAIVKSPGKQGKYPSLYIHSNSGLGKTHLLHAVANGIKDQYPHYVVTLITARDFMKEFIDAVKDKHLPEFQQKYSEKVDVLMIDDIHELKNKTGTQDELFHIFNELYNQGKQLIFTSDKAPGEIDGIEERIKSRLQWGLVVDIQKPDLETRIAILKKKAYQLDLYLPDDILSLIASSIKTNIRELEGSLVKLSAFADVMKVELDAEMVKNLLDLKNYESAEEITLESVAKAVSHYFKIPVVDLKSKARNKDIVRARFIGMYLSRKVVNETQQEIGRFYGNRDHSSVIHAVKDITLKIKEDMSLSKDVIAIENSL